MLRVAASVGLARHGLPKLIGFAEMSQTFPDPLGIGARLSLGLAIFGEFFCPILIAVGLFARLAAIPPLVTMLVAALIVHAGDPFSKKELALAYAVAFAVIALIGPGHWSIDHIRRR